MGGSRGWRERATSNSIPHWAWARAGTESVILQMKEGVSHGRLPGSLKRPLRNQLIRMQTDTRPHPCPDGCHTSTHTLPPPSPFSWITHLQCPVHLSQLPVPQVAHLVPTPQWAAWGVRRQGDRESGRPTSRESSQEGCEIKTDKGGGL